MQTKGGPHTPSGNSRGQTCPPLHSWHTDRVNISPQRRVQGPGVAADQPLTHRVVAEELTVAAVAELPIFLVGGGGGAGTALRAAVLVLPEPLICLARLRRVAAGTVREFVTFARGVPEEKGEGQEVSRSQVVSKSTHTTCVGTPLPGQPVPKQKDLQGRQTPSLASSSSRGDARGAHGRRHL